MYYLGIDVGSVSTDLVLLNEAGELTKEIYLRTKGNPIAAICEGMDILKEQVGEKEIAGVGTTGSGRTITSVIVGADSVKNEITAHGMATSFLYPEARTILEIGGQDSKIILLKNGLITDFAMNTVCAAGTGSFLDRQAERMGIPIEEFSQMALASESPVRIAGRCAVFAESDIIHKQQMGYSKADIINGMCMALVRNYLSNVAKGKKILPRVIFQGGVAANAGIKRAFETLLGQEVTVPREHKVMGAVGAALLAKDEIETTGKKTEFRGFGRSVSQITTQAFECQDCHNNCEVIYLYENDKRLGCFSDRCGKYQIPNRS